ncbi:MAG: hypothetical protein IPL78_17635 [Chloroflexi bacterium]|nr:hypothetical protein [Chloroflexota bacterium]
MDAVLEGKLIDCLDALERGETLEEILRRYPDDAAALRPLLETAHHLATLPVGYSVNTQRSARNAFLQQAAQLRNGHRRRPFLDWLWRPPLRSSFIAAALVVMLMGALLFSLWDDLQPDETVSPNGTMTVPAVVETPATPPPDAATTPQATLIQAQPTTTPPPGNTGPVNHGHRNTYQHQPTHGYGYTNRYIKHHRHSAPAYLHKHTYASTK